MKLIGKYLPPLKMHTQNKNTKHMMLSTADGDGSNVMAVDEYDDT